MEQLKTRDQLLVEDTWALEDLYPSVEAWEAELATLAEDQAALCAYAGTLGQGGRTLYEFERLNEEVEQKADRLANYCMRLSDQDTRDPKGQQMVGRFVSAAVAMSTACGFATPEILAIDDATLDGFYRECPELERYRRALTDLRRRKAHTLSAAEEKLLASAGEMARTPDNVFSAFIDADVRYPDAVDSQGQSHGVSGATFVPLMENSDRILRESAYCSLYDTLGTFRNTLAAALNAQHKQLKFFADARHYPSTLDAALDRTNVPTSVYRNLIAAIHENMDKMHRYVRLRKKMMGVEELHFYDIYAPLVPEQSKSISIQEAKQAVLEGLAPLGADYRSILEEGFANRWIDVYPNAGKRGGAYSAGGNPHPYVLLNYTGTLTNQFTLAHEMGHSVHTYLSCKHQNPVDAGYVIFVAEVASTCNEALLMQHMLGKTTDWKERIYLINHFLEKFKGTMFRQTMFAEFELRIGELVGQGQTLTAEILCKIYKELNESYFGPDIVVDDRIALEWARIPHFYYNYYVFQYATGFAAAIALSRRILREGERAVQDYLSFLSGGCSKSPIELLKGAGVDMTGPEAVNQALALFGELLDEMEQLIQE